MKALVVTLSRSSPLYISIYSASHFIAPFIRIPTIRSPFSFQKPTSSFFKNSMATCLHFSLPETPSHTNPKNDEMMNNYFNFCRTYYYPDLICCVPIEEKKNNTLLHTQSLPILDEHDVDPHEKTDDLWIQMRAEARSDIKKEPILSNFYCNSLLSHNSLEIALAYNLAMKLSNSSLPSGILNGLFLEVLTENNEIISAVKDDLKAVKDRDPACISYVHCFLNFKGFLACQSHRIAHTLWSKGRKIVAVLIQNRVSEVFAVDIHPGAKIGRGILLDHATGVVIGETAVIGDNVSILHNVTLGGTGKVSGDRHPKIGDGVLIGAGTCVLGNVRIEDGAKIGAGSVVLKQVPARTTAVGNPAKLIGGKDNPIKMDKMPSFTMDHTSWSDYVI